MRQAFSKSHELKLIIVLQDCVIVSKNALDTWLTKHAMQDAATSFAGNQKVNGNGKGKAPESTLLSVSEIACPHGLLDPEKAPGMKRITSVNPRFTPSVVRLLTSV